MLSSSCCIRLCSISSSFTRAWSTTSSADSPASGFSNPGSVFVISAGRCQFTAWLRYGVHSQTHLPQYEHDNCLLIMHTCRGMCIPCKEMSLKEDEWCLRKRPAMLLRRCGGGVTASRFAGMAKTASGSDLRPSRGLASVRGLFSAFAGKALFLLR